MSKAIESSIDLITKFVIPLYTIERSRPLLVGSGFVVASGKAHYLISAAHVLNQASDENPLYTYRTPSKLVRISGKRFLSDPDGLDLGFVVTDKLEMPWREVQKLPCDISYLHGAHLPRRNKHYVIAGYPETKNRANPLNRSIPATVHAYHADSLPDDEYGLFGLSPERHIALPLDLKRGVDFAGKLVHFPKPNGMSGSPIWELYDESIHEPKTRTFPIVGVATNYRQDQKLVFGTDIGPLLFKIRADA